MTYYHTCPHCGANLDPGEVCNCAREDDRREGNRQEKIESSKGEKSNGDAAD